MTTPTIPVLLVLLGVACASGKTEPKPAEPPPAPPAVDTPAPATPAPPAAANPTTLTPADLYGQCRSRVEGPSAAGECETDADCTKTGCSGEVCTTTEKAQGMMTTCEVLPCFQVLDTCGCVEGICSWSLKDGPVKAGQPLPVKLPQ